MHFLRIERFIGSCSHSATKPFLLAYAEELLVNRKAMLGSYLKIPVNEKQFLQDQVVIAVEIC
jgi:hypothetical protein